MQKLFNYVVCIVIGCLIGAVVWQQQAISVLLDAQLDTMERTRQHTELMQLLADNQGEIVARVTGAGGD